MTRKSRAGKPKRKTASCSTLVVPSPPTEAAATEAAPIDDVLPEFVLQNILRRLSLADLLRAALASHRWCRLASRCLPRAPPLLGYFFHPTEPHPLFPKRDPKIVDTPAVFAPVDASAPRLSLDFAPDAFRFFVYDSHQGLLLLEPSESVPKAKDILPRFLVLDPATRRRTVLSPPPRDTVPDDRRWRRSRYYVGSALLSRTHPSKLCFEAVCFAIDGGHPRAWVASVDDCARSRGMSRSWSISTPIGSRDAPYTPPGRSTGTSATPGACSCWILPRSSSPTCRCRARCLPTTTSTASGRRRMDAFAWSPTPSSSCSSGYAGRAGGATTTGFWRGEMMRGMPSDPMLRTLCVWPSDMDAGRTGKVFIKTWGFGRFSFHMDTGKMERLSTKRGKEYGHPMFAYFLAWPPAFLAPEN